MNEKKSNWQLQMPEKWIRAVRTTEDGTEQTGHVGYIASAVPDGRGYLRVKTNGPEGLLLSRPLPFHPPMVEQSTSTDAFEFHWKLLDYVFGLRDPASFPRLTAHLDADDQALTDRYIATARDLAASGVVNATDSGMTVDIEDHTDIEHVLVELVERDRQVGFAALLRHCDSHNEPARFGRVADILWKAVARGTNKEVREQGLETIKAWRKAAGCLHQKSLDQQVRDKMVAEEDAGVLAFDEEHSPAKLLSIYDYGDLLHWDRGRDVLAQWDEDDFRAGERRLAFLAAACALAHLYIGFAVLAATATATARSA